MATQFERYLEEVREIQAEADADSDLPQAALERLFQRLIFLREQIDLSRIEAELALKGAVEDFRVIQGQLDDVRNP